MEKNLYKMGELGLLQFRKLILLIKITIIMIITMLVLYQITFLNDNRTSLVLDGTLADKVADSLAEREKVIFAERFRGITDLEVGPDDHLYVLSIDKGAIYRILPK